MSHQVDCHKTAVQNMTALINTGSTVVFKDGDLIFGEPYTAFPEPNESELDYNTKLMVGSPRTHMGFKIVSYRRLELGSAYLGAVTTFKMHPGETMLDLKKKIATEHNLVLGEFDLVDRPADIHPSVLHTLVYEAKNNSLIYTGGLVVQVFREASQ